MWALEKLPSLWIARLPESLIGLKYWASKQSDQLESNANQAASPMPDIIEMAEIYTFVKKQQRAVVWLAYCQGSGRVVAQVIGEGKEAAIQLYKQVKVKCPHISYIATDANSCYGSAFAQHKVKEEHSVTKAKHRGT